MRTLAINKATIYVASRTEPEKVYVDGKFTGVVKPGLDVIKLMKINVRPFRENIYDKRIFGEVEEGSLKGILSIAEYNKNPLKKGDSAWVGINTTLKANYRVNGVFVGLDSVVVIFGVVA